MKAMVLQAQAPIETQPLLLCDLPEPEPGPGQVRIRVQVCGLCHTDLHIAEGELPLAHFPRVLGHQVVGLVERVGQASLSPLLGQRVGLPWLHSTCQKCALCQRGLENLCPSARFTGFDCDGGYGELALAEAAFLVPIPEELTDPVLAAPLLCGGIIGYRALRLSGVRPGQRLGLFGFGASAHIVLQLAQHQNIETFVFTRTPKNQQLARKLGAAWVGDAQERPEVLLDGAISFSPAGQSLRTALECIGPGSTVACAGIYVDQMPALDYDRHLFREKVLRSVTAATREDALGLMQAAVGAHVRTDVQPLALAQANQGLLDLKHSRLQAGAGVLLVAC